MARTLLALLATVCLAACGRQWEPPILAEVLSAAVSDLKLDVASDQGREENPEAFADDVIAAWVGYVAARSVERGGWVAYLDKTGLSLPAQHRVLASMEYLDMGAVFDEHGPVRSAATDARVVVRLVVGPSR
ncbi:MAG: hypothetical protein ACKN9R_05085 [Candidatus Limnocylindrus sp.]